MKVLAGFACSIFIISPSQAVVTSDGSGTHLTVPGVTMFGINHDGVVQILRNGSFSCSGALLEGGRHVLTAGHCVANPSIQSMSVRFILPDGEIEIEAESWEAHPLYQIESGYDVGIITLEKRAPIDIPRYQPLRALGNEINVPNAVFGYGVTGYGLTGKIAGNGPRKRGGRNQYEATSASGNIELATINGSDQERILFSDFDSGLPENDGFGVHFQKPDLGFGDDEGYASSGDSGGPIFIQNRFDIAIAGAVSGGARHSGTPGSDVDDTVNGTWGQFSRDTRISAPETIAFIDSHTRSVLVPCPLYFEFTEGMLSLAIESQSADLLYLQYSTDLKTWETYQTLHPTSEQTEVPLTGDASALFKKQGYFIAYKETGEIHIQLPDPGSLFAIDSTVDSRVLAVSNEDGFGQLSHVVNLANLEGLAYNPQDRVLYSFDPASDRLISIDANTGTPTETSTIHFPGFDINGIAYHTDTGSLFVAGKSDLNSNVIIAISPNLSNSRVVSSFVFEFSGLAYHSKEKRIYASSSSDDSLYRIDPDTGDATRIGSLGIDIDRSGLAYEAATDSLYLADENSARLYALNLLSGAATALGALNYDNVTGLAANNTIDDEPLYSTTGNDLIGKLFPITGESEQLAALDFQSVYGLALDANTQTLYGIDIATDVLITIDPETGTTVEVGPLNVNFPTVAGLAFDPVSKILYATSSGLAANLYSVNTQTGNATAVGPLGRNIPGLAYIPSEKMLYGVSGQDDSLYKIDPQTGQSVAVGSLGVSVSFNGLAFSAHHDSLYMVITSASQELYQIDRTTGVATPIAQTTFAQAFGLAADNLNP